MSTPLHVRQLLTILPPGSTRSSSYLSLSCPQVSISLKFCDRSFVYTAPALWNGLPKDLRQFAHPPNRALNFHLSLDLRAAELAAGVVWKTVRHCNLSG